MNVVDLVIIVSLGLLALVGFKGGIIRPASGIGGVVLGVIVGLNYQAQMAALLAPHISGNVLPRLAGFVILAVLSFALVKAAAFAVTSSLPKFKLGRADHIAGALGGVVVGVLLLGTLIYLAIGANVTPAREVIGSSFLAPKVAKASLVSPSVPWCSQESGGDEGCHSYTGLIGDMFGVDIKGELQKMLSDDQDVDQMFGLVKATLSGDSPEQLINLADQPR